MSNIEITARHRSADIFCSHVSDGAVWRFRDEANIQHSADFAYLVARACKRTHSGKHVAFTCGEPLRKEMIQHTIYYSAYQPYLIWDGRLHFEADNKSWYRGLIYSGGQEENTGTTDDYVAQPHHHNNIYLSENDVGSECEALARALTNFASAGLCGWTFKAENGAVAVKPQAAAVAD